MLLINLIIYSTIDSDMNSFPFADSSMPSDFGLPIAKHKPKPDWIKPSIKQQINPPQIYTWQYVDDTNMYKLYTVATSPKEARRKLINSLKTNNYSYSSMGYYSPDGVYSSICDKITNFIRSSMPCVSDVNIYCVNTFS
jgi:hypothetical protein